jgi:tetratricopeptide (TPR) repeat protein
VQAAYERRDLGVALRAARAHLERWPGDRRAALMAARCLTRLGSARQAEPFYDQARPLGLDDLHARAYSLVRADEPERAAWVYEELLARRPDDVLALKRLGAIRIGLKQWRRVLELAGRLIQIPSAEVAGWTLAGIADHETKHYGRASAAFERVLQLDPELKAMPLPAPLFWNNLALDLVAQGRSTEARTHLSGALTRLQDASLMELLGLTYQHEGATDRAECCWRQAVEWDPNNGDAWLDLGRLALHRRLAAEAIPMLDRAAALSPFTDEPLYNLSQAHRLLGNHEEADRYRRRAEQLRRSKPRGGTPRAAGAGSDPSPGADRDD